MKKLIVANWKMLPQTLGEAMAIMEKLDEYVRGLGERAERIDLVVCPPFVFIEEVAKMIQKGALAGVAVLGAQDVALEESVALTGEVSGPMLAKLGVRYVIVGHSERRWKLGESDEVVNAKLKAALRNELVPIVCLGERTRDAGYEDFLRQQTKATFAGLSADDIGRCLIAYEPVWAISTTPGARPDTPKSAVESLGVIQQTLISNFQFPISNQSQSPNDKMPKFLYGGSVTSLNAAKFLSVPEFAGVLIGGASVNKEEFVKILADAVHIAR